MAKWKEKPWRRKGNYYPNAQRNKGIFIPQDRKQKIKKTREKISNYMGYNKPRIAKPVKLDNKAQLEAFARETRKNRRRTARPEKYDDLVNNWYNIPELIREAYIRETILYYTTDKAQDMIRRRKEASGSYKSPLDSVYYTKYIIPYYRKLAHNVNAKYEHEKIEITKDDKKKFQMAARNWLSNKISPEEFEQSFKTFEQGEELIKLLYENSKYVNTDVTFENYRSAFYSVFRNMLQKCKSQYDSNTIRTYLLSNGIDEYNDGDDLTKGITPERLDEIAEAINPKIGLVIADTNELNALMAGNEPPVKRRKAVTMKKPELKIEGGDDIWYEDGYMKYFKGFRRGDMTDEDIETLSGRLPTKKELLTAQKILTIARQKAKIDVEADTIDLYSRIADVMDEYGSDIGIDRLSKEAIENIKAMNMLKYHGKWDY